jgi:glycosyltransferase involved in cell wall biosynthesis
MNIVIVAKNPYYFQNINIEPYLAGHTTGFLVPFIEHLLTNNHNVTLITPKELQKNHIHNLGFPYPPKNASFNYIFISGNDIPKVPFAYAGIELQAGILYAKKLMKSINLVMVVYTFPWICAVNSLKEREPFKTIAFLRGSDVFLGCNPYSEYRTYFEEGIWEIYTQIVIDSINKSDRIFCVSKMQKDFSENLGIRIDGIYPTPPFEDESVYPTSKKELKSLFCKKVSIKPDISKPWILYLGRFHAEKRPDIALKAFSKIGANAELIMAGVGLEQERLERIKMEYALENVNICFIPSKYVPLVCLASEIMLHPVTPRSFIDARPSSCTNASYYGCPIIFPYSRNIVPTGLVESVSEDNIRFLGIDASYDEERIINEMGEKIKLLLGDEKLRNSIGQKNREHAKKFSKKTIFPKLEEEMESACNE